MSFMKLIHNGMYVLIHRFRFPQVLIVMNVIIMIIIST